ncbi:hypothetical protein ABRY23_07050 [Melioribacteraceae bacterium 4301-Me]|uniref:hypothetical protein n=1 Tax=Pyranulibacter aquaticus TaxID=3163344 RepID=UPI003594DF2F
MLLKRTILLIALGSFILFVYVMVFSEIKKLNLKKLKLAEQLSERKNKIELMKVDVQKLSTEERIVKIAEDSLGLIRATEQFEVLYLNSNLVKQIQRVVNQKYE